MPRRELFQSSLLKNPGGKLGFSRTRHFQLTDDGAGASFALAYYSNPRCHPEDLKGHVSENLTQWSVSQESSKVFVLNDPSNQGDKRRWRLEALDEKTCNLWIQHIQACSLPAILAPTSNGSGTTVDVEAEPLTPIEVPSNASLTPSEVELVPVRPSGKRLSLLPEIGHRVSVIKTIEPASCDADFKRQTLVSDKTADKIVSVVNCGCDAVNLSCEKLSDFDAAYLSKNLSNNQTLTSLDLRVNGITEIGINPLAASIKTNKTLLSLQLNANPIGNDGLLCLVDMLSENTTLQVLKLSSTGGLPEGLIRLCEIFHINTSLKVLWLRGNNVGDVVAGALAENMDAGFALQELDLRSCGIGDEGGVALADGVGQNQTLTKVNLSANAIRDGGIVALVSSCCRRALAIDLDLNENSVSTFGENFIRYMSESEECQNVNIHFEKIIDEKVPSPPQLISSLRVAISNSLNPLHMTVSAAAYCKALIDLLPRWKSYLVQRQAEFQVVAVQILSKGSFDGEEMVSEMLKAGFDGRTAIEIADSHEFTDVLAHPVTQDVFQRKWISSADDFQDGVDPKSIMLFWPTSKDYFYDARHRLVIKRTVGYNYWNSPKIKFVYDAGTFICFTILLIAYVLRYTDTFGGSSQEFKFQWIRVPQMIALDSFHSISDTDSIVPWIQVLVDAISSQRSGYGVQASDFHFESEWLPLNHTCGTTLGLNSLCRGGTAQSRTTSIAANFGNTTTAFLAVSSVLLAPPPGHILSSFSASTVLFSPSLGILSNVNLMCTSGGSGVLEPEFVQTSYILRRYHGTEYTDNALVIMRWLLAVFVLSMAVAELMSLYSSGCTHYFSSSWNLVDCTIIVSFCIFVFINANLNPAVILQGEQLQSFSIYEGTALSLAAMATCLRVLRFASSVSYFGPLLLMINGMIADFKRFLSIFLLFLVAFGMSFLLLFAETINEFSTGRQAFITIILMSIGVGDTPDGMESTTGFVFFVLFLVTMVLVLLNLLIAMFSSTYAKVEERSDELFKATLVSVVKEYQEFEYLGLLLFLTYPIRRLCGIHKPGSPLSHNHLHGLRNVTRHFKQCDKCREQSFVGTLHHCVTCGSYDLCPTCAAVRTNFHDDTHEFVTFAHPGEYTTAKVDEAVMPVLFSFQTIAAECLKGMTADDA